jgi:hypothetical protein
MIRTIVASCVLLSALAVTPAAAADLPMGWRRAVGTDAWIASPYYVVDQGPVFSGPGIMIVEIGITPPRLMRYPFIGRSNNLTRVVPSSDYYTVYPRTIPGRVTGLSRRGHR